MFHEPCVYSEVCLEHFTEGCGPEDQLRGGEEEHVATEEIWAFVQKIF